MALGLIRPTRKIGDIVANVTMEEKHHDVLEITDHPVERGANISDHAFKRPNEVTIRCGWSDSVGTIGADGEQVDSGTGVGSTSVADIYQQLLTLQASAVPVDVYTGKRKYTDMLLQSITTETDAKTEYSLICLIVLRQVIIVNTTITQVSAPAADQADPSRTDPVENDGTKQLVEADPNNNLELGRTLVNVYPDGSFVEAFPVLH